MRLSTMAALPVLLAAVLSTPAPAQQFSPPSSPHPMPLPSYNAQRAYRHFLTSPSSFRTYSGSYPGFSVARVTPYGYERFTQGPGYLHAEISPRGFSRHQISLGQEYVVIPYRTPVAVAPPVAPLPWSVPSPGGNEPIYPYDGGPRNPIPLPGVAPPAAPLRPVPGDGRDEPT
jgi:hypothetical protein